MSHWLTEDVFRLHRIHACCCSTQISAGGEAFFLIFLISEHRFCRGFQWVERAYFYELETLHLALSSSWNELGMLESTFFCKGKDRFQASLLYQILAKRKRAVISYWEFQELGLEVMQSFHYFYCWTITDSCQATALQTSWGNVCDDWCKTHNILAF